jgi:L-aminoadipate-semialdehyde dehydrogenase
MQEILKQLGIKEMNSGACTGPDQWLDTTGDNLVSYNPTTNEPIASVTTCGADDYEKVVAIARKRFESWRVVPAPKRGLVIFDLGEKLREYKDPLGKLVTLEMGKIYQEGLGEVQEMIDICDFAVGLSRQLYGKTMHSERPLHRMYEQWHPLGVVGIISAFNFPVAVWAWNAAIAAVCGDTMVWKPSKKTPLTAVAVQNICNEVMAEHDLPGLFNLVIGPRDTVGEKLIADPRIPLVSATGSVAMGKHVGGVVGHRLGRSILELGGNNGIIVMEDADLDLVVPAILFGAVGTAGQRCTTTRRILVQKSIANTLVDRLTKPYLQVRIGDPLDEATLMGPLIDQAAITGMQNSLEIAKKEGAEVLCGGEVLVRPGNFVTPCIVRAESDVSVVKEETFAPILYIIEVDDLEDAIAKHNEVPQGLSSAIFTKNLLDGEQFLSHQGSDCGIANINIGTSGAEIGGAFGGEKDTGGGREAGSDSWKAYMRRQTNTINWSTELPLAQGIKFGTD